MFLRRQGRLGRPRSVMGSHDIRMSMLLAFLVPDERRTSRGLIAFRGSRVVLAGLAAGWIALGACGGRSVSHPPASGSEPTVAQQAQEPGPRDAGQLSDADGAEDRCGRICKRVATCMEQQGGGGNPAACLGECSAATDPRTVDSAYTCLDHADCAGFLSCMQGIGGE